MTAPDHATSHSKNTLRERGHPYMGFLGPRRFRCQNPRFRLLDSLGFPWILSSETRLINGLRGLFRENFFAPLFP